MYIDLKYHFGYSMEVDVSIVFMNVQKVIILYCLHVQLNYGEFLVHIGCIVVAKTQFQHL